MKSCINSSSSRIMTVRVIHVLFFWSLALSLESHGQDPIQLRSPSEEVNGRFGRRLALIDDVDGDGKPDIAVVASQEGSGRVHVFGSNGYELVVSLDSPDPAIFDQFGLGIVGIDDVNSNGSGDILVSMRDRLELYDGSTGQSIVILDTPNPYGATLSAVPDVTGDDVKDVLAALGGVENVFLFNSVTGELLRRLVSPSTPDEVIFFGSSIVGLDDVDDDGFGDAAVASLDGDIYLFSGTTGEVIRTFENTPAGTRLRALNDVTGDGVNDFLAYDQVVDGVSGESVVRMEFVSRVGSFGAFETVPDIDGDGVMDLAIGTLGNAITLSKADGDVPYDFLPTTYFPSFVDLYSGATGQLIFALKNPNPEFDFNEEGSGNRFGRAVLGLPDINGDTLGELVIGDSHNNLVYIFLSPFDRYRQEGEGEGDGNGSEEGEGSSGDGESQDGDGEVGVDGEPGEGEGSPAKLICAPSHTPMHPGISADLLSLLFTAGILGASSPRRGVQRD